MKYKKTITAITILMALPLIFAIYGGENQTLEFSFETDNCTIVPNITEGINFTFNGNTVLVEPALNFIGEFNITCYDWQTKEEETQSGGSSGSVSGWSAKCGYDKECLYGKTNVTKNITQVIDTPINTTEEIIEPEPVIQEDKPNMIWVIILLVFMFVLGLAAIIYLLWKIFKPKEELPEPIGFNAEDYDKEVTSENGI